MKTIKEQLDNAKQGLCNTLYHFSEAINNNDSKEKDYWFKSILRFTELIDELEAKAKK